MSSSDSIERHLRRAPRLALAYVLLAWTAGPAHAGTVTLPNGMGQSVRAESIAEARFRATVRQQYDFSCGAAAVATLLTHHYAYATSEPEVFRYMWRVGDRKQIQAVGFSLLDMKRFLNAVGYAADGYRITLDQLAQAHTPAIALISTQGYRHFVVIQGVSSGEVLISDPAVGARSLSRRELEQIRDEVLLVIRPDTAPPTPLRAQWRLRPSAPVEEALAAPRSFGRTPWLPTFDEL